MKGKLRRFFKSGISSALVISMLSPMAQLPVKAEAVDVYIPEVEIEDDILSTDVFYLASASAQLQEGANERYLLRIARGGDCASASGVTVKIADLTAKYGEDYTISLVGDDTEVDNPENNESLIERMEGQEYTESELLDEEEYMAKLQDDDELYNATVDAYNSAINYIESESGILPEQTEEAEETETATEMTDASTESVTEPEETNTDEAEADAGRGETAAEVTDSAEQVNTNPLQQARSVYTGVSGEPQRVTSTTDTYAQIQQMANVITNAVVGATLTVDFAEGESEKYIAIDVLDNGDGDGDRYFYLMLAAPYGTTTNSAASSCAVTILDDEEQAPSEISFTQGEYSAEGDSVTVEITRTGAINTIAAAHLTTEGGSAQAGRDFSPVDMDVVFPMGIDKRTIDIPIRTEYITGDADFNLKLETVSDCVINQESAVVRIAGTAMQSEDISLAAVEESARVSDIVLGKPIDLSKPVKTGQSNHFGGANGYEAGNKQWRMMWKDNLSGWDHFWGSSYKGLTGASWTIASNSGADLAGVQVDWARSGSCAEIGAVFVGSGSRDIAWNCYNESHVYKSRAYFGDGTKTNMFCTYWDPVRITLFNAGNCKDCNNLWIHSITPIYRPFVINLQNADALKFLNADGTYSTWNDATFLSIAGANNDTNNQVVRYTKSGKNAVTLQQTVGGNVTSPYVYLKNINIVKDGRTKTVASYGNDGYTSHTFTMDSNWINNNSGYIYFEENNSSNAWKNQTGTFGLRGRIEIKPVFDYKDAKIKINVPENNFGYFNVSGKDMDISSSATYTYHMGDTIKLSTVMRDEYSELYAPAGYKVSYKYNESDTNWIKRDVIVPYEKDGGTSEFLDDNGRLRYGYYEITPLFERKDNSITVRVREDNLWYCDQSYGIFTTPYVEHVEIDGVRYNDYIVYDEPVYGKIYSFAARKAAGLNGAYYAYWKEPDNDKTYSGEVFFHEASNDPEKNIIELSINYDYFGDLYQEVSGSVYRPTYNMATNQVGYTNMLPAAGALVNFGTSFAVVGEDGSFKIPAFRTAGDHQYTGEDKHYIRYMIAYNGEESLRELRLTDNGYKYKEISYTVTDDSGNSSVEKKQCLTNSVNTGQQLINTENGSIINNIEVYSDAVNQGYNLIIDGDSVTLKAKCTSPVKYTKQTVNENGELTEIKNADENVTGIEFVIYDSSKNTEIASYPAEKQGDEFVAEVSLSQALPGNSLYLRVTTDRSHAVYGTRDENGNVIEAENSEDMNKTTYADVFTGYTFTQKNTEQVPVLQNVDLPVDMNFESLPLLGDTAMQFDLPFVSVGSIKTDTGYKLYIGVSPTQIADTALGKHMTSYAGDTGAYYKELFSIKNPIKTFKEGLATTYKEAFSNVPEAYSGATSALGAPTWKLDVQVGVYFDFVYTTVSNPNNGAVDTVCVFTGVGGYIGVSAGVKMAWYTILPVVFIPAYFGIDISGNVLGFFGAGTDTSKPKITYDDASNTTVDFDDKLGEFKASVKMAATVQVYVGVGLAGTIGLRGGGTFTAMGMWEPSDLVSDWGADLVFTAGIWIDLFLFSVPLQYTFPDIKFGSFKEYAELADEQSLQLTGTDGQSGFTIRQPYSDTESEWLPDEVQLMSAFGETSSQTIVENGYEHPDVQLLKLNDGSVFMAFLDTDMSRGITERTVLKYAVYKDGSWSDPQTVQNDATADFQPSICEIDGGRVMISWLSSDPEDGTTEDSAKYLSKLEVYTAVIDPSTGEISEETRLTDDGYYDYNPISVYDEKTGDRIVYYVKTASNGSAEEMVNSYANDCVVVYMLYSKEQGRWLFDYYYDEEVASEEDRENLINNWHGQRFLSSPIPELGLDVPNISDFTAITYNGISVYAYTIDQDSSNDTTYDKEMFIQCYDFETHKTYVPIRITNDSVSDDLPQFVRTGSGEAADTRLFWYRDEKNVAYIDISSLVYDGVNDDGTIKDEYLTGGDGEKKSLDSLYSYVSAEVDNQQGVRSMADFKAVTDGDDIYIVWTQPVSVDEVDDDGNYKQCREVYATALIQDENDEGNDGIGEPSDGDASNNESGCSWAAPYRLTNTNAFTDEPNAVIDGSGNLMVLYNSYNQEITEDADNPVKISDFKLKASYMEPCGAVEVTDIAFSDETPVSGDTVEVNVSVKNAGLTYAEGYTVNIYEMRDGAKGALVKTIDFDGKLNPGNTNEYSFEWTAPENVSGVSLFAEAQEGGMTNISEYESASLEEKAVYEFENLNTYQDGHGYHLDCTVTNTGNEASTADDSINVILTGPYAMALDYTLEECNFAKVPLEGIGAGETKSFTIDLNVVPRAFDEYGYVDCLVIGTDKDGSYITNGENIRLMASQPLELMLNGGQFPESIELKAGETMEFNVSCTPQILSSEMSAAFGTDDTSVAVFDGTTLKALSAGTTVIHGSVTPYGTSTKDIVLTVTGTAPDVPGEYPTQEPTQQPSYDDDSDTDNGGGSSGGGSVSGGGGTGIISRPVATPTDAPSEEPVTGGFTDVKESDWFFNSVQYTAEKGYMNGTGDGIFEPYANVTRGMLVTVLGRIEGVNSYGSATEYSDVRSDMYYAPYIAWATENGIVDGYGDNLFGPDDFITREQIAKIAAGYIKYKMNVEAEDKELEYTDAADISEWAVEYVRLATQLGILEGNDDGTFAPKSFTTRAETAAVTERLSKLIDSQK